MDSSNFALYDLDSDVGEQNNLLYNEDDQYAEILEDMYVKLKFLGPCPDDSIHTFKLSGDEVDCDWFESNKN